MATDSQENQKVLFRRKAVPVMVPMPVDRAFTYAVPEGETVVPGSIV